MIGSDFFRLGVSVCGLTVALVLFASGYPTHVFVASCLALLVVWPFERYKFVTLSVIGLSLLLVLAGVGAEPIEFTTGRILFLFSTFFFVAGYLLLQILAFREEFSLWVYTIACLFVVGVWSINALIQLAISGYFGVISNVFFSLAVIASVASIVRDSYRYWVSILASIMLVSGYALSISGIFSLALGSAPYSFILVCVIILLAYITIEYHKERYLENIPGGVSLVLFSVIIAFLLMYYGLSSGEWMDIGYILAVSTLVVPIAFIIRSLSANLLVVVGVVMVATGLFIVSSTFLGFVESIVVVWFLLVILYIIVSRDMYSIVFPSILFLATILLLYPISYSEIDSTLNVPVEIITRSYNPVEFSGFHNISASIGFNDIYASADSITLSIDVNISVAGEDIMSFTKHITVMHDGETNIPIRHISVRFPDLYYASIDADSRFVGAMLASHDASSITGFISLESSTGVLSLDVRVVENATYIVTVLAAIFIITSIYIRYKSGSR